MSGAAARTSSRAHPIAVIAGNPRQYEDWLRLQRLTWREAFYVGGAEDLIGREIARFVLVGTRKMRGDATDLVRLAETRLRR